MKTRFLSVGLLIVFLITFFTGCFKTKYEWDGRFSYYYEKNGDFYVIAGLTENLETADDIETLYIPSHYKGKEVRYTYYKSTDRKTIYPRRLGIMPSNIKSLYLSYLTQPYKMNSYCFWGTSSGPPQNFFLTSNQYDKSLSWYGFHHYNHYGGVDITDKSIFVTSKDYDEITTKLYHYEKKDEKRYCFTVYTVVTTTLVSIANVTYKFNYENAPNDNYFFINNFERGGLIKNTPYEPTRDGYKFAGWYKEPECINAWNFEKDTLPPPEYDENGDLIFIETILYAKWNKI